MITEVTLDNKAISMDVNRTDDCLVIVDAETNHMMNARQPVVSLWDIGCEALKQGEEVEEDEIRDMHSMDGSEDRYLSVKIVVLIPILAPECR